MVITNELLLTEKIEINSLVIQKRSSKRDNKQQTLSHTEYPTNLYNTGYHKLLHPTNFNSSYLLKGIKYKHEKNDRYCFSICLEYVMLFYCIMKCSKYVATITSLQNRKSIQWHQNQSAWAKRVSENRDDIHAQRW